MVLFAVAGCSISIHALRVEGDDVMYQKPTEEKISIHALRVEGDTLSAHAGFTRFALFLSTPSGWRATVVSRQPVQHELRDFYPRPPGGGRQQKRTKFSSVFAQKGEEIASLRRGKRKFAGGVLKRTNFGF